MLNWIWSLVPLMIAITSSHSQTSEEKKENFLTKSFLGVTISCLLKAPNVFTDALLTVNCKIMYKLLTHTPFHLSYTLGVASLLCNHQTNLEKTILLNTLQECHNKLISFHYCMYICNELRTILNNKWGSAKTGWRPLIKLNLEECCNFS